MTPEKLRDAQHPLADRTRGVALLCHELGDMPASTFYHYLHPDGSLKTPGCKLLGTQMRADGGEPATEPRGDTAAVEVRRARADA
jgi:hypothetical protein